MMKKFDAIVIGSGQAGTPLVFKLAAQGKMVAFIEKDRLGGTCLNVGCTPTKAYVASARRIWDTQHGDEMGVEIPAGSTLNLKKVKERKDKLLGKSRMGLEVSVAENKNITFFHGEARFTGHKTVEVNGEELSADLIFINVGGRAFVPGDYAGVPHLTNESILELEELPERLLVVGGSYIGLEFGQMFARFGSKVTIIERGARIISREDEEVSQVVQEFIEADGVEFRLNASCIGAKQNEDGTITIDLNCDSNSSQTVTGTHLLLAIGRSPNTDRLNLAATGIETDKRGFINVDDYCQTNVEGIFALGDCNGKGAFTHTAYNDFQVVEDFLFGKKTRKISDRIMTYGLFVDPPLGRVGMTQEQALAAGHKIKIAHRPMTKIARAREKGETYGFMSAVIDAETDKFLGAVVLGVGGDEIISSITNVMYADQPYTLIRDSVQVHPTVTELIPTMLEKLEEPES